MDCDDLNYFSDDESFDSDDKQFGFRRSKIKQKQIINIDKDTDSSDFDNLISKFTAKPYTCNSDKFVDD